MEWKGKERKGKERNETEWRSEAIEIFSLSRCSSQSSIRNGGDLLEL